MIIAFKSEMNLIKYKILLLIPILSFWFLTSCGLINEDVPELDSEEKAILVLRVNKIASSTRTADDESESIHQNIEEKINSLRIIIINENNLIEVNQYVSENLLDASSDNIYTLIATVSPGQKNFFILANEAEVTGFSSNTNPGNSSLTEILDSYKNKLLNGAELTEFLNSVSFSSDYRIADNSIALPYSSFYTMYLEAGKKYEKPMYLVPAATKYTVNISNSRKDAVLIKDLYINSIANQNYLMPHVEPDNYYMDGRYWIDWLADVSEQSHDNLEFENNQQFNDAWGWITDYQLPEKVQHSPFNLLTEEGIRVDAQSNPETGGEPVPGSLSLPVFYEPESKNLTSNGKNLIVQNYSIKMTVQADGSEEEVTLTRTLSNVKALFRNTHLILNIEFSEGYMHVYGEIIPWTVLETVNGYVTEETEQ